MAAQKILAEHTVTLLKYALSLDQLNQDNLSAFQSYFISGGIFDNRLTSLHSERHVLAQKLGQALNISETLIDIQEQTIEWKAQVQTELEKVIISEEYLAQLTSQYSALQSQLAQNTEFLKKSSSQVEDLK